MMNAWKTADNESIIRRLFEVRQAMVVLAGNSATAGWPYMFLALHAAEMKQELTSRGIAVVENIE